MNVVFASNYLNVHQHPFCDAMLESLGSGNFTFIAGMPFNQLRLSSGYTDMNQESFVIRAYEDEDSAVSAALNADVLIGIPYSRPNLIDMRLEKTGGLTFAYSERLLKRGLWFRHVPRKRRRVQEAFCRYAEHEGFQVLCASAFTSFDLSLFGFPQDRCWKWGYFPQVPRGRCLDASHNGRTAIVWVGRMIEYKRPFLALRLARMLVKQGYDFHLTMVGEGDLRASMEDYIRRNDLGCHVTMTGALPNADVHRIMSESDVFLFTSNREEGWGAVLNEAMANGCVPVASSLIGSVPYLLDGFEDVCVFADGNTSDMCGCVTRLLEDRDLLSSYKTRVRWRMEALWNPENAVKTFIELSQALLDGRAPTIDGGPCSDAGIVKETWLRGLR